jgi:acetyl-CoA acetyltransferase
MSTEVCVIGVGMTPFKTPKSGIPYTEMGRQAIAEALEDAGLEFGDIQQAYAGYVYGDSTSGQRVLYQAGLTGIPIINVNNNCATGSTALYLARQAVQSGAVDCALALGFEQMSRGALGEMFDDRPSPIEPFMEVVNRVQGPSEAPLAPTLFGGAGREYMERHGIAAETFGRIAVKARRHAACNPRAVFRDPASLDEIMNSPMIFDPLTRLQCCPPTCGAAAAVVCSERFAASRGARSPVRIAAQAMTTDTATSFESCLLRTVGYDMTASAASAVYEAAGIGPEDVDVVELHDCFTANELISYEALGLTAPGTAERFILEERNTYGGDCVVNPSGGLLSKGHPLGATGLAQCAELVWQLRGDTGPRQVEQARIALQHNLGLGGACVVTLYQAMQ